MAQLRRSSAAEMRHRDLVEAWRVPSSRTRPDGARRPGRGEDGWMAESWWKGLRRAGASA